MRGPLGGLSGNHHVNRKFLWGTLPSGDGGFFLSIAKKPGKGPYLRDKEEEARNDHEGTPPDSRSKIPEDRGGRLREVKEPGTQDEDAEGAQDHPHPDPYGNMLF